MKKGLIITIFVLSLSITSLVEAKGVKHTLKKPSFFVPEQTLKQANKPEKVPTGQQMLKRASMQNADSPTADLLAERQTGGSTYITSNYPFSPAAAKPHIAYKTAPIDKILAKQPIAPDQLKTYKESIVRSYYLLPSELKTVLQDEADTINADTKRMIDVKQNWHNQSPAFRAANYKLNEQISTEIAQSRKNYLNRKKSYENLIKKTPASERISVIEATNELFLIFSLHMKNSGPMHVSRAQTSQNLHFISVFDSKFNHVFSYHRKHIKPNKNRRIYAAKSGNPKIDAIYQPLFDSYLSDLERIGAGLDINNPILLRQISQMQNKVVSESY